MLHGAPDHTETLRAGARSGRCALIALAFGAGIASGAAAWAPPPEWWLAGTGIAGALALALRRRPVAALAALAVTIMTLGAAWVGVRRDAVAPDDLVARLAAAPAHLHVAGTALAAPAHRTPSGGVLSRFDYRGPYTEFPLEVDALLTRAGERRPIRGRLLVRVGETVPPFRAGDRVEARGTARRGGTARNPGGFDHDVYLRSQGFAGVLTVSERTLLSVEPDDDPAPLARLARYRAALRAQAESGLFADMVPDAARDATLAALLFGRRDRDAAATDAAFRRVGLAHLLAISGLHLGILVTIVLLVAGRRTGARAWHAVLVAAVVLLYLLLIDVRLPVLRAAVMTTAGALAQAGRRRWPGASLVALSGLGLLVWRPHQLFEPGFQLSFGVVLALVHYGPAVRARWFGAPDPERVIAAPVDRRRGGRGTTTFPRLLARWLGGTLATAAVAWAVATPITVYHFGMISPGAVPLSVVALPLLAMILAIGYLKILLAVALPSAALLLGFVMTPAADALVYIVTTVDTWPGSVVHVPRPAPLWAIVAAGWAVTWARGSVTGRARRVAWIAAGLALLLWLAWPALALSHRPDLRIDTLDVGDGTCQVLRSNGRTALFDAGSSSGVDAGRMVVVPALRALGVRTIDWIAISHANLDHFSAVPEIVAAYPGTTVIITPQLIRAAADDPEGSSAFLLGWLARERVPIRTAYAGVARPFGAARVRWLHPAPDTRAANENDNSMAVLVETAHRRALLTGDVEADGIARLRDRSPGLRTDVLELPHHGSFSPAAVGLVDQLDPALLIQSTGHRRLERDAWATHLGARRRLVTARDGACRVEFDGTAIRIGVFGKPWATLDPRGLR